LNDAVAYGQDCIVEGIRSRMIDGINGLNMHILEAGHETPGRPLLLLLHGFPELAFSWRKVMPALAAAGYHVVAPDQRGYGRTTGWDPDYDGDVRLFRLFNIVHDALALVMALGYRKVAAVIGHDFGSPAASWCSLLRPDVFTACVMMSAPFGGIAPLPFGTADKPAPAPAGDVHVDLAALPRPRKHYQWYYSTRPADSDMRDCPQGLHDFLRAYYHMKSADWRDNRPFPLKAWSADELAKLPTYYVMDLHRNMAETVAPHMPAPDQVARCQWLSEAELAVYAGEFARTGFQGGLQWYRCRTDPAIEADLSLFSGRTIDVPSCFIGGASDWGIRQVPGALENMQARACTDMRACHLVDGAGHWVQQEQPEEVGRLLLAFLEETGR
jgi:pimeloyl-ACP methyl ester carboxylesterase